MLSDITLGQFYPKNSVVHRLDPRTKLSLCVGFIVLLFLVQTFAGFAVAAFFVALTVGLAKLPLKLVLKSLKPLAFIVYFTAFFNIFYTPVSETNPAVWEWWIFRITAGGLRAAAFMSVRILLLVAGTSLLTYTTSPILLTDGLERLLKPLKWLHLPVHELAMMMTIALRFIPTLIEETEKIMNAQKARGADFESGSVLARAKALIPILVPLFISSFRRAEDLATAMECRCYHGGEGRTRMTQTRLAWRDAGAFGLWALCLGAVILFNIHGI